MQIGPIKNDDVFATAKIDSQGHYSFSGPKNPLDINRGEEGKLISEHTMFPEASIGKIRYAGLSYMMQERGFFGDNGLQANAKDFFSTPEFNEFLSRKFPDTKIQESILKLFNEDNKDAKLADLLTHRAGIGDTTSHGLRLSKGSNGLNHHYTIVDLLSDSKDSNIERDATTQKPLAKQPPYGELGSSIYGNHEYSNLGYQLMGLALEYSYEKGTGVVKNYEELLSEFMLKPLSLNETKFHTSESDDRVNQSIVRMDQSGAVYVENPQNFNGALSAGGVQVSLADADKYYQEFFKGFPVGFDGENFLYKEPREKNIFFSEDTIDKMANESLKFGPANQWSIDNQRKLQNEYDLNPDDQKERPKIPEPQYQFPGFVATMSGNKIISYSKTGETFGGKSKLMHDPVSGKNIIEFEAKGANIEVLTSIIATEQLLKESGYKELSDKEKENKIQIRVGELIDAGYDFKKIDSEIKSGKEIAKIAEESKEKIGEMKKGQEKSGDGSPSPSPTASVVATPVAPPLNLNAHIPF